MGLRTLIQVFHEHEDVPPKIWCSKIWCSLSFLFYNNKIISATSSSSYYEPYLIKKEEVIPINPKPYDTLNPKPYGSPISFSTYTA
jgi:hypothetical protein